MDGSQFTVSVRPFRAGDERRWDEFVRDHAGGTFFHLSGWKRVIERAFGHRTYYLIAERGPEVTGVLPLTHVKSMLFGSSLISNAFSVRGGPIAEDPETLDSLEAEAVRLMDAIAVPVLELRDFSASRADWPSKGDLYASFVRSLHPCVEDNLKSIPRKQRAMIRKGMLNKLKSEIDDDVERLYRVYAESVRNLGTPVFSKSYFRTLREEFSTCSDIVTITSNGQAVASVLNFYFRDEVLPFYGGGVRAARALAANDFMYWEVMRKACERGYRKFDFGRSKIGTGSFAFKRNWGFQPTPLVYQFRLSPGTSIPDLNPLNPKLRMFIAVWKRLPLAVATRVGPSIVRGIG
jgi:FemAB-related protein (PEP-CTERM system-associated)